MADIQEYKCPSCGGAIAFDSSLQKMKCPFCDTEFEMETLKAFDKDLSQTSRADQMRWETPGKVWHEGDEEGMRVYVCKSCGGQIIGDENMGATSCPYCDNPVVLMGQFTGDIKPDYIIPFKLDKAAAKKALKKHYNKPFTPAAFTRENHIDEIKGIYVPFWIFDTDASGSVRYKATQVRTWSDTRFIYTETSYFSLLREGTVQFMKIPADGSSKMDDTLMESLEPFNFNEAVDFQTAYMAGYLADRYDVTIEDNMERINNRVKTSTESVLAGTALGYTTVVPESSTISTKNGQIKYAMYPVWLLNTTWNGKRYTFAMNGQTGKMVGDIPVDKGKVAARFALIGGIAAAVALAVQIVLYLL
ncbi:MAG: hypothetical protein ACOX75_07645 [Lachnospiraceae bacterium]|jgi:DNA-directed RNA polymerase subunit RPC12/RpoP